MKSACDLSGGCDAIVNGGEGVALSRMAVSLQRYLGARKSGSQMRRSDGGESSGRLSRITQHRKHAIAQ